MSSSLYGVGAPAAPIPPDPEPLTGADRGEGPGGVPTAENGRSDGAEV